MPTSYHQTVITEKRELDEKIIKLKDFYFGDTSTLRGMDPVDRGFLGEQYKIMQKYSDILRRRIERFK